MSGPSFQESCRKIVAEVSDTIKLDPQDASAYCRRSLAHSGIDEYEAAISDLDMAIQLDPLHVEYHVVRGFTYGALNHKKAIADFDMADEMDSQSRDEEFIARRPPTLPTLTVNLTLDESSLETVLKQGGFGESTRVLLHFGRACSYDELCEYGKALDDFDKAIGLVPDEPELYLRRGLAHLSNGTIVSLSEPKGIYEKKDGAESTKMAIADFTKVIQLNPLDAEAYIYRSQALTRTSALMSSWESDFGLYPFRFKPTLADLNRAIELEPDSCLAYFLRASCYKSMTPSKKGKARKDKQRGTALRFKGHQNPGSAAARGLRQYHGYFVRLIRESRTLRGCS